MALTVASLNETLLEGVTATAPSYYCAASHDDVLLELRSEKMSKWKRGEAETREDAVIP